MKKTTIISIFFLTFLMSIMFFALITSAEEESEEIPVNCWTTVIDENGYPHEQYLDSEGFFVTGWQSIDNCRYFFDMDTGYMQTDWCLIDDIWYYFDPVSGQMFTGWLKWNNKWYYLAESGEMLTGWQWINEKWYLLASNNSGRMLEGWQYVNGNWYYLQPGNGSMHAGWLYWNSNWYYLKPLSGFMYNGGWAWVGNVDYKFSSSGKLVGAWVDVPCQYQYPELPTGCESLALTNALGFYGFKLAKATIADKFLPWSSTDYITSFMGNPHSPDGGMTCAPGIVITADRFFKNQSSPMRGHNLTGNGFYSLCKGCLDYGRPVIIWVSIGYTRGGYVYCTESYQGHNYSSIDSSHTVVLCGYDDEQEVVWLSDSISGKIKRNYYLVKDIYNYRGRQAVVLY